MSISFPYSGQFLLLDMKEPCSCAASAEGSALSMGKFQLGGPGIDTPGRVQDERFNHNTMPQNNSRKKSQILSSASHDRWIS